MSWSTGWPEPAAWATLLDDLMAEPDFGRAVTFTARGESAVEVTAFVGPRDQEAEVEAYRLRQDILDYTFKVSDLPRLPLSGDRITDAEVGRTVGSRIRLEPDGLAVTVDAERD